MSTPTPADHLHRPRASCQLNFGRAWLLSSRPWRRASKPAARCYSVACGYPAR